MKAPEGLKPILSTRREYKWYCQGLRNGPRIMVRTINSGLPSMPLKNNEV